MTRCDLCDGPVDPDHVPFSPRYQSGAPVHLACSRRDRLDEVVVDRRNGCAYCGDCADARDVPPAGAPSSDAWSRRAAAHTVVEIGATECDGCGRAFREATTARIRYLDNDVRWFPRYR